MEVIRICKENELVPINLLSGDAAKQAFDLFKVGKGPKAVRFAMKLPLTTTKTLEIRFGQIRDMMERIVRGEAYFQQEESHIEIDEESGESTTIIDVEEVKVPASTTITTLKARSLELISQDHDMSEPLFAANSIEEVVDVLNYMIEEIIKYSNPTQDSLFPEWRTNVLNL